MSNTLSESSSIHTYWHTGEQMNSWMITPPGHGFPIGFLSFSKYCHQTSSPSSSYAWTFQTGNLPLISLWKFLKISALDESTLGLCAIADVKKLLSKQIIQLRNGQKTWIDISPKKTYRWPTDTWKNAQHHSSSGKIKSRLWWDTISHQSE